MQDWKMTDKFLAISDRNYGVWKMQDWKMMDKIFGNLLPKIRRLENAGQLCGLHMSRKNRLM